MRIAVAIDVDRNLAGVALEQFRRGVMLLKIDEHRQAFAAAAMPRANSE
jgi:hypothetical protein